MPISLTTLVKAAPFKDETREKLLRQLDSLSERKKFMLSNMCWTVLLQKHYAKLKYEQDKYLLESQEQNSKHDNKEIERIEARVTQEFVKKLKDASTDESVEDIREELKKHIDQPVEEGN